MIVANMLGYGELMLPRDCCCSRADEYPVVIIALEVTSALCLCQYGHKLSESEKYLYSVPMQKCFSSRLLWWTELR